MQYRCTPVQHKNTDDMTRTHMQGISRYTHTSTPTHTSPPQQPPPNPNLSQTPSPATFQKPASLPPGRREHEPERDGNLTHYWNGGGGGGTTRRGRSAIHTGRRSAFHARRLARSPLPSSSWSPGSSRTSQDAQHQDLLGLVPPRPGTEGRGSPWH